MFAKLYLDENVSVLVAEILRSKGFDAVTAQDFGKKGMSDAAQMEFASKNGRVIVTHDRVDFELLAKKYFENNRSHKGVIIAHHRHPNMIAERLLKLIDRNTAEAMVDQIVYI